MFVVEFCTGRQEQLVTGQSLLEIIGKIYDRAIRQKRRAQNANEPLRERVLCNFFFSFLFYFIIFFFYCKPSRSLFMSRCLCSNHTLLKVATFPEQFHFQMEITLDIRGKSIILWEREEIY